LNVIRASCRSLTQYANDNNFSVCVLPRPGCANGGLNWSDVKPILLEELDDRFYCITYNGR
jgi:hypothetical protein